MKVGIFIEPDFDLKLQVLRDKSTIFDLYGNQTYLKHLPHCSIYVFNITQKQLNKLKYNKLLNLNFNTKNITIKVNKTNVFKNDLLTNGDTYCYEINKNKYLDDLQKKIIKFFLPYVDKKPKKTLYNESWMNHNYDKFGFPFVGKKWIPHITLASISTKNKKYKFLNKFLKLNLTYNQKIDKVSVYKIQKEKHKFLWHIFLNNN